ncbi:transposase [Paraburkholderia sp. SIMBA_030]|uniref:transposase n=1 Tax=Paraburkholderia sp. SIMBA_030 TaxID=3085773 RepID=UPI00397E28D3
MKVEMAQSRSWQAIPTKLSVEEFELFVWPHLSRGSRGPARKLSAHAIFNYILRLLYLGCQWKELPIDKDHHGCPEIHYTRIYRAFRRWEADGCLDAIFEASVLLRLHQDARLDTRVIHGDGTTSAVKKGGDNLGFSGRKKVKGCKVVALCDRNCNAIAPFVSAPGNRNESPLLREALPRLTRIARAVGLDLLGTVVSLDGVYDCRRNRKAIFNRGMVCNINANSRGRKVRAVPTAHDKVLMVLVFAKHRHIGIVLAPKCFTSGKYFISINGTNGKHNNYHRYSVNRKRPGSIVGESPIFEPWPAVREFGVVFPGNFAYQGEGDDVSVRR